MKKTLWIYYGVEDLLRQTHDKYQREENITQTVVITTYCNDHKVPSGMIFFRHIADNYFSGIRIRVE